MRKNICHSILLLCATQLVACQSFGGSVNTDTGTPESISGIYHCTPTPHSSFIEADDITIKKIDATTIGLIAAFWGGDTIPLKKAGLRYQITAAEFELLQGAETGLNFAWQAKSDGSYTLIGDRIIQMPDGQLYR